MVDPTRPTQLAALLLLLHLLCPVEVRCWGLTPYLFGGGDANGDEGSTGVDDFDDDGGGAPPAGRPVQASLSSFREHARPVPPDLPVNRGRRDVEASVKAHGWPTTALSPLCEAWAYLEAGASVGKKGTRNESGENGWQPSPAWRYLDVLAGRGGVPSLDGWWAAGGDGAWTYQNSASLAIETASAVVAPGLDENLLPMALSLRAKSPHCEMHRSLARDAAISLGLYRVGDAAGSSLPAAFAVVSWVGRGGGEDGEIAATASGKDVLLGTQVVVDASLLTAAIHAVKSGDDEAKTTGSDKGSVSLMPLPEESFYPPKSQKAREEEEDDYGHIVAILYGQVGTTACALMYQSLKESNIKFIVRHMGHIPYEEEVLAGENNGRASPTVLQGYGVRLDIRNVEYKAFDDPDEKNLNDDAEFDWNEAGHPPDRPARDEYLAGVNLRTLLGRLDGGGDDDDEALPTDLQALQTALLRSHPAQRRSESIVPPAWQRRPLSLQAAAVIAASADPLETLKGVSQNLPSAAHHLSAVRVPEDLDGPAEEATALATRVGAVSPGWGDAAFGLFVNGRPVDVERPSFNVFQLLDVLRAEDARLRELERRIRPVLQDAKEDDWEALQAARNVLDMGPEKLARLGKRGFDNDISASGRPEDEKENGDDDDGDDDSMTSPAKERYRIDVARGGKNAVLYLNDVEKDPEYRAWPKSMQEMFFRSQYGGAPTVRRNLFTLLVVLDPASPRAHPALDAAGQLLNGQFPLRLAVLVVNDEDVAMAGSGSEEDGAPPPPAQPWNGGDWPFHARDSFLLLKHVSKKFGGFAAISTLIHAARAAEETPGMTARELIGVHLSLLEQMGLIHVASDEQSEMETLLESGGTSDQAPSTKKNNVTYEHAVKFAAEKLLRPGMSFLNGIPFPHEGEASAFGAAVNEVLQYEQRHIMGLAMKGVITDTAPRSIYATILKGDKLFKQYHPLLRESSSEYVVAAPESDWRSLMLSQTSAEPPGDWSGVDAIFLVEGVFDFDDAAGIEAAVSFLDLMNSPPEEWRDSKTVSLVFRMLPSGPPKSPRSRVLSNILCVASEFDPADLTAVANTLLHGDSSYHTMVDAFSAIESIDDISGPMQKKMIDAAKHANKEDSCPVAAKAAAAPERRNFYVVNGRVYVPVGQDALISMSDIQMLLSFEMEKSHAITKLMLPHLLPSDGKTTTEEGSLVIYRAIGISAAVLNEMMMSLPGGSSASSSASQDFAAAFNSIPRDGGNPLYFSWNDGNDDESSNSDDSRRRHLRVNVSVILDALTEPAQRVAPLLLAMRDFLKLPLRLILAPRMIVQNDAPISSYYRFVVEPDAFGEKLPEALFHGLPTEHLLTMRMDVPEQWDVQQAFAVQDADNLRCDARNGCGDERIEYDVKNLLFFGQCYDVSQSTPPNGLQLTLDRLKSSIGNPEPGSTAEIEPDGEQEFDDENDRVAAAQQKDEHTDSLVMKTVGYWQLRANPGVWDLRIAEKSRGAEIYHMVDGSVKKSGKIQLSKNSSTSDSKTLVMKDFTNQGRLLLVKRRNGFEQASLFGKGEGIDLERAIEGETKENETVHVFSLATGHAYERLLKIMMLSVTKRTSSPVKFWLFENFLSPSFKSSAKYMAEQIGCKVEFVTYKWPEWLRGQTEKQRIIWGYKILFLDVLFPLDVRKIIYVDADQVVRGDMTELWNLDLEGKPYGYTPFCDSREETIGYQFWRTGFWQSHLRGKPYHISALYVVDLDRFRRELVGDRLRSMYQQLSADPNSLANLDQDLPNYAQHDVPIFSLPQKWLWCESWCSDDTKAEAMTIDLCNNPEHKEAKISMAKRIISGDLFEESWAELDAEVSGYNLDFVASQKLD